MIKEEMITGYQWSPVDSRYIGEYRFPVIKGSDTVHMPPNTTLEQLPQIELQPGQCLFWRGTSWVVEQDPNYNEVEAMPVDDYSLLSQWYIDFLKQNGKWTAEHQAKLELDVAAHEQREREQAERQAEYERWIAETAQNQPPPEP